MGYRNAIDPPIPHSRVATSDEARERAADAQRGDVMEAKHTPGPWSIVATPDMPRVRAFRSTSWHAIAPLGGPALAILPNGRRDTQDANAALIAAAPDLLLACEAFVNWYEVDSTEFNRDTAFHLAKEAIARAEARA